jgi:LAO/AO transport system kinase
MSDLPDAPTSRRALAQSISTVERGGPAADRLVEGALDALRAVSDAPLVVGVTGAPGTGKSSLVARLADVARARGRRVAILAVDPSSDESGGALLGDRIRIDERPDDDGRFVRSLATRGSGRALAQAAAGVSLLLEAAGYSLVFVETVGAGQADLGIARLADVVLVVEGPEGGDEVQAMKAGLLEVADLLVVNKGDRPGADAAVQRFRSGLAIGGAAIPVLLASAHAPSGIDAVLDALEQIGATRTAAGRTRRVAAHLVAGAEGVLAQRLAAAERDGSLDRLAAQIERGNAPLADAASRLVDGRL